MTQMDEATTSFSDAHADNVSDYGDFGSDAEEVEILDALLAQAASGKEDDQDFLIVTDIEDYEPPRGLLLPSTIIQTRPPISQVELQAEIEVLRDLKTENRMYSTSDVSLQC